MTEQDTRIVFEGVDGAWVITKGPNGYNLRVGNRMYAEPFKSPADALVALIRLYEKALVVSVYEGVVTDLVTNLFSVPQMSSNLVFAIGRHVTMRDVEAQKLAEWREMVLLPEDSDPDGMFLDDE